jgi:hypothetical protein
MCTYSWRIIKHSIEIATSGSTALGKEVRLVKTTAFKSCCASSKVNYRMNVAISWDIMQCKPAFRTNVLPPFSGLKII